MAEQLSLFENEESNKKKFFGEAYPLLLEEWDYEKNINNDPYKLGIASAKRVWWICSKGHSYKASVGSRTRKNGTGCPYCANQKVLKGFNDLETKHPDIAMEWDYVKNAPIKPCEVLPGTQKKYWWICPKNHSYCSNVSNRVRVNAGCPYCANKAVLKGYNDLATTNPDLLTKWNYEKNNELGYYPTDFTSVSGKKVWWKCNKGHEWEATIAHIAYGRGCPICNTGKQTSFPEQVIFYYIHKIDSSCINRYKMNGKNELDVFIPTLNIGIEYDGYRWHRDEEKKINDITKSDFWNSHGVKIIRIKEQNKRNSSLKDGEWLYLNGNEYYLNDEDYIALSEIINDIINKLYGINMKIDIKKDQNKIYNNYLFAEVKNSLIHNKKLMKYYDYEKNLGVKPEYITRRSGKVLWWRCDKGHSFQASVHSMAQGIICLECKKEMLKKNGLVPLNDNYIKALKYSDSIKSLLYEYPELSKEWDYEKNYPLRPENIVSSSRKNVWWKCSKGHSWQAMPINRIKGHGCKMCGYKKAAETKNKKIVQYTKEGKLINSFNSIKEAELKTSVKHVSDVCNGKRKYAGGYIWKYK